MQVVTPFLMFDGQAEAAMNLYVSVFEHARIESLDRYGPEQGEAAGKVSQAIFSINGQRFRCFDSPVKHAFGFTPALSLAVSCETAAEVDAIYARLAEGGKILMALGAYPFSPRYAWLDDRFGVSWQLSQSVQPTPD